MKPYLVAALLVACNLDSNVGSRVAPNGSASDHVLDPGPVPDGGRWDADELQWSGTTLGATASDGLVGARIHAGWVYGIDRMYRLVRVPVLGGATETLGNVVDHDSRSRRFDVDATGIVFASPSGLVTAAHDGTGAEIIAADRYGGVWIQGGDVVASRFRRELDSGVVRSRIDRIPRNGGTLTTLFTACDEQCVAPELVVAGTVGYYKTEVESVPQLHALALDSGADTLVGTGEQVAGEPFIVTDGAMYQHMWNQSAQELQVVRVNLATAAVDQRYSEPDRSQWVTDALLVHDGVLYWSAHAPAVSPPPSDLWCAPVDMSSAPRYLSQGLGPVGGLAVDGSELVFAADTEVRRIALCD